MANVVIQNLCKAYPDKSGTTVTAVNSISLEIKEGEFMVLVGPSGCGKSTTLRMIAGLEEITGGTISIDGREVNDVLPKDRDIAMVFQNYALYPHMSVYDNMAFGLKLRKFPKAEIDQRVREAAALLGLEAYLERRPKALSGGQRQRVAVGRAIVRKPKVFLFDEPLSNLDAKMRVSMRAEISKLHARLGATMIYVTHDQVEAMTMGDRICVMRGGEIMQVAEPLELYHRPANAYVAGFIGSPPMNLIRGRVERRGRELWFVELGGEGLSVNIPLGGTLNERALTCEGREIIFGIRPEDIACTAQPGSVALTAKLELDEQMGAETHLHFRTASHPWVARVPSFGEFVPGSELTVHLQLAKAHLFDAATEQCIN
ncbi:ABC transporter ATP-binding protein [Oleiharenicola lentus]|uniref:ABC transporter ATP-binding protein n=1 Tax=Oleiharenicola lentus TaxID=2508720 RepID=UPI003F66D348